MMRLLEQCHAHLEEVLPGLRKRIELLPFSAREAKNSPVIKYFKEAQATKLLISEKYGGQGVSPLSAFNIQLALASLSPSLGIASGMHQFSVASLVELSKGGKGLESLLLEAICKNNMLLSSAFSEGGPIKSILSSQISAKKTPNGYSISGIKQPCSLADDMDLLTVSVNLAEIGSPIKLGVAMIAKNSAGITIEDFWNAPFFNASQSEKVILKNVEVHKSMMISLDEKHVYSAHIKGFVWFEFITCACYLGIAARLLQKIDELNRLPDIQKVNFNQELSSAYLMFKAISFEIQRDISSDLMVDILSARYALEKTISELSKQCITLAGGFNYLQDNELLQLTSACHALQFHPPSKQSMQSSFLKWTSGQDLELV